MPLILVIVADPHEAAQLATLIQGRLAVDLVQAAEVGEGLLALEDRIPDLILTSPLMSPFDDGVLDEYLRDLGPSGAHVQTLRIPVLSQAPKKAKRLGFSLRRRTKPEAPTIDGCEPKVFADEIEQYLARATEEKRHAASSDQASGPEREDVVEPIAEEQWTAAYSEDEPSAQGSWSAPDPEPEPAPVAWRADLLDRPPVEETPIYQPPSPIAYEEPAVEYHSPVYEEAAATWREEVISAPAPVDEAVAIEPAMPVAAVETITEPAIEEVVETAPIEAYEAPVLEEVVEPAPVEALPAIEEAPAIEEPTIEPPQIESVQTEAPRTEEAPVTAAARSRTAADVDENKATPSFKAALAAIRAAWGKPPRKTDAADSVPQSLEAAPVDGEPVVTAAEAPASFEVDLTDVVEVIDEEPMDVDAHAAAGADAPADPIAESVEVYELSVEPDLDEFDTQVITPAASQHEPVTTKTNAAAPVVEDPGAVETAPATADVNGDRRKKGKRPAKGTKAPATARQGKAPQAAQNEWGIFDPNQCGFAALVDKLDEVADEKTKQPQNGAKVRVISLS